MSQRKGTISLFTPNKCVVVFFNTAMSEEEITVNYSSLYYILLPVYSSSVSIYCIACSILNTKITQNSLHKVFMMRKPVTDVTNAVQLLKQHNAM